MIIGHYGVSFVLERAHPAVPLWHYIVAVAVALSLAMFLFHKRRAGVLMAVGVFSHFVLDYVTHNPDLPIFSEDFKVGLGLWNYLVPAFIVENVVLFGALAIYLRGTHAKDALGKYGMIGLCLMGTALLAGFPLGVLPSDIKWAEAFALFNYGFVCWATWHLDKRRVATDIAASV